LYSPADAQMVLVVVGKSFSFSFPPGFTRKRLVSIFMLATHLISRSFSVASKTPLLSLMREVHQ
jgi:hypothetical protein